MAKPSDIVTEVAEVAEAAEIPAGPIGTVHRSLDEQRRAKQSARRTEALTLRLAGLSYEQIGTKLGIQEDSARDLVERTLSTAHNRAADSEREVENARLDRAQAAIWTRVLEGDLKAVDTFLRLSQRRARMNGLDAPTNINVSVNVRAEMEQALATLEQVVLGEVIESHVVDEGGA